MSDKAPFRLSLVSHGLMLTVAIAIAVWGCERPAQPGAQAFWTAWHRPGLALAGRRVHAPGPSTASGCPAAGVSGAGRAAPIAASTSSATTATIAASTCP